MQNNSGSCQKYRILNKEMLYKYGHSFNLLQNQTLLAKQNF